jgi:cysteine sulfinate desulfinase/cysteine desulfurase-like protein
MKRIFSILSILLFVLVACDNADPKTKEGTEKADSTVIIAEQKRAAAAANEKMLAELEKMTPLPEEELKKLLPEMLMDAATSNSSVNSTLGASVATAEYQINDSTKITLSIYDCAGPGGAGLYNLQYAGLLEYTADNPTEYTKVIDFNGSKAIEHCKKQSIECSFTYFSGERYLMQLDGKNVNADKLKRIAGGLKIK